MLGSYDPLLHGWVSRAPLLAGHEGAVTVGGLFRPFALVDGRAAGIWRLSGREVQLEPFGRLSREVRAALDADAEAVVAFLFS